MLNLYSKIDEYFFQIADKKINVFDNIRKALSNVGAVCVFGTGHIGNLTVNILNTAGVKIDFLCDNDSNKWDKVICGLKCYSPNVLKSYVESASDRGGYALL